MKDKIKLYEKEYWNITERINGINEELVILLNKIENDFSYNPFNDYDDDVISELWKKVSIARNFNIY